jgi:hypothetical protein
MTVNLLFTFLDLPVDPVTGRGVVEATSFPLLSHLPGEKSCVAVPLVHHAISRITRVLGVVNDHAAPNISLRYGPCFEICLFNCTKSLRLGRLKVTMI